MDAATGSGGGKLDAGANGTGGAGTVVDAAAVDTAAVDAAAVDAAAVDAAAEEAGAGRDAAGSADAVCGSTALTLQGSPVDLLLVLDKSGSMSNDFRDDMCPPACDSTNPSKWTAVTQALTTVLTERPDLADWGLELFPTSALCTVDTHPAISVGPNNATAIVNAVMATSPSGATPTAIAEATGAAYLMTLNDSRPRYIVLVTDGEPNCAVSDPTMADDARAIQAVADAFTAGVPTFVVGIGNLSPAQTTLNGMATAGGEAQPADALGRTYFPGDDPATLLSALTAIAHGVASCNFVLASPPASPADVVVLGDGHPIARDAANGWSYGTDTTVIVLHGAACTAFRTGAVQSLSAVVGCSTRD
jgi:Mg-chelatase subunit ChlD